MLGLELGAFLWPSRIIHLSIHGVEEAGFQWEQPLSTARCLGSLRHGVGPLVKRDLARG
jgi:hypothetical protein